MLSKENKQTILNGTPALSRDRRKCKYIGKNESSEFPYQFVYYGPNEVVEDIASISEQFCYLKNDTHNFDIIGLWKDGGEPFNLEKALQGEPVLLRNGSKAYVKFRMPENYTGAYPLRGYYQAEWALDGFTNAEWTLEGREYTREGEFEFDIIGMYEKPELKPNMITLILPCTLKEPRDGMWFLSMEGPVRSTYNKNIPLDAFERIPYFGSKEDAQAWFDAMQNSRR